MNGSKLPLLLNFNPTCCGACGMWRCQNLVGRCHLQTTGVDPTRTPPVCTSTHYLQTLNFSTNREREIFPCNLEYKLTSRGHQRSNRRWLHFLRMSKNHVPSFMLLSMAKSALLMRESTKNRAQVGIQQTCTCNSKRRTRYPGSIDTPQFNISIAYTHN